LKPQKSTFALVSILVLLSASITWAQTPQPTSQPTSQPTAQPTAQTTPEPTRQPPVALFADEAFKNTWARTDQLVAEGLVRRSWYWGPQPNTGPLQEEYAEGVGGKHLVQYFDKSRMEINNPNGDKKNPFYVTNGLLAQEMITGKMQVGNTQFVDRFSAQIPLASDVDDANAPTYASFRDARRFASTNRVNNPVNQSIDRNGVITTTTGFDSYAVKYTYFEAATKHNIPGVFWNFLNESGPVIVNAEGQVRHARLTDPYFYATGYPVTEAYWAKVKIAGVTGTDVLIQAYERRVLTYVPSLPEEFRVQVGNIGQHYYDWRYRNLGNLPDVPTSCGSFLSRTSGIGKQWNENAAVRRQLGCPYDDGGRTLTVAQQTFEHGQMFDVIAPGAAGQPAQKTLYVLYEDGSVQRFDDKYVDGTPEPTPTETPPTGFLTPVRGFGKAWNENPTVRQRLGWAAQAEQVFSNSVYIPFERGIALTPNPGRNEVYVMYDDKGLTYRDANKWVVYAGQ
jgi:hypothetical protein